MTRTLAFAKRNFKELIRDKIALIFEILLPLFLLFIFQQFNIPSESYQLQNFTPGIIIFGLSFITLFTATLVAKDRTSSLLVRLGASPMKPADYIFGYILALLPIVILQNILFFIAASLMGLTPSPNMIYVILISLIIAIFFITLGILIGSLVSEKATGGVGSIVVQLVCFTSGIYFPNEMVGAFFVTICKILPFESFLTITKSILNGTPELIEPRHLLTAIIYIVIAIIFTCLFFNKKSSLEG